MTIEKILNTKKEHPAQIWANTEMDELRRIECLCINCGRKEDEPTYSSCPAAKELYNVSVKHSMAMDITRCGATDKDGELLYIPLK